MNGALKAEQYYTYEEWLEIDDGNRYELLDGTLYMMASPTPQHQAISMEMGRQISNFLVGKPCRAYAALDVRLHKEKDTVFEPDISVICDSSKISKKGCEGAPDLVVEILSPSTSRYDRFTKFHEYRRAGVLEYWLVDPEDKIVTIHRFKNGECDTKVYSDADTAPVQTLPGCEVDLSLVFRD